MITTEKLVGITAQHNEIVKRVGNGSLDPDNVRKALQRIIEGKFFDQLPAPVAASGTPSWYVLPEQQLERVAQLNTDLKWGFGNVADLAVPEDFVPRTSTEVLMLNICLPRRDKQSGLHRTFDELWSLIQAPQGYSKYRWDALKATAKLLRQAPGYSHDVEVGWIALDPNAYHGLSPEAALEQSKNNGVRLAGTEVLMAALLFPDWVSSWNGTTNPYPNLSGIQFYWNSGWSSVPYLDRWGDDRRLRLRARRADGSHAYWASPSVREC
jgi:hypothetical protein